MTIYYSSKFFREYKKLPITVKKCAEKQEILFCKDPFHPELKTHKLKGKLDGFYAFWIDRSHRIIFECADKNTIWFHSVGDHSIYNL